MLTLVDGSAGGPGGSTGPAGSSGTSGLGGISGTTGAAAATGSAGTTGVAGTTGIAGETGTAGTSGSAGTTGSAGRGGTTGMAGATGTAGTTGSAGRGGTTGMAGTTGTAGATGSAGRGGTTGTGGQGTCPGAAYTGTMPPTLTLSGSLGAHDPATIVVGNTIYLAATGLIAKTSTNLTSWQNGSNPLNPRPAWVGQQVPGATNLWAPDISFFGGMYHLYYAASTFGSNESCIGHATRAALDSGSWADQGTTICSNMGTNDNWNAIDPNIIVDAAGTPWMSFGSFWSGVKMIKLDSTGKRADTMLLSIANRPSAGGALEGPWIFERCGTYYLFVSWGACCNGAYDYNIRVGRSTSVTGPYMDKAGTAMTQGGGTLLVQGNGTVTAPGHNAILVYGGKTYNVYHALNASHGNASLRIAELLWDTDGWPVSGGP